MVRQFVIRILVALQVLMALSLPTNASTVEESQHRALHTVLTEHGHNNPSAHINHEASHGHGHDLQLSLGAGSDSASDNIPTDHHHHDFNVSAALLLQHTESVARGECVQNPCALPSMHSAERRTHLRPPQA